MFYHRGLNRDVSLARAQVKESERGPARIRNKLSRAGARVRLSGSRLVSRSAY